jgi:hypothetical protein
VTDVTNRSVEPFTWAAYEAYLELAIEIGYTFMPFTIPTGRLPERAIFLRHDIDFAMQWLPRMAAIEQSLGVGATYCVQPDSRNYSIDAADTGDVIRDVLERGHWLGLHFDATGIDSDDEVVERVTREAEALSLHFQTDVEAVSFHMPGRRDVGHLVLPPPLINTYAPQFFEEIAYVSDSNQDWRGQDLVKLLRDGSHDHVQILIHPMWWRETYSPMMAKLRELANNLGVDLNDLITPEQRALPVDEK